MANRKRPIQGKLRCTPEERALIDKRMEQVGTMNMAAYLRKMAIDGYVVKLELPELREMVSLLRRSSNNLNQIARRVNSTNRVYNEDIQEILRTQVKQWEIANTVLSSLASINRCRDNVAELLYLRLNVDRKIGGIFDEVHIEDIVCSHSRNPGHNRLGVWSYAEYVRMGLWYYRSHPRYPWAGRFTA